MNKHCLKLNKYWWSGDRCRTSKLKGSLVDKLQNSTMFVSRLCSLVRPVVFASWMYNPKTALDDVQYVYIYIYLYTWLYLFSAYIQKQSGLYSPNLFGFAWYPSPKTIPVIFSKLWDWQRFFQVLALLDCRCFSAIFLYLGFFISRWPRPFPTECWVGVGGAQTRPFLVWDEKKNQLNFSWYKKSSTF